MNTEIISKAYFHNIPVIKLYQGSDLVWPFSRDDIALEYISNGTGQHPDSYYHNTPDVFYDTGVVPSLYTSVEIKYSYTTLGNNCGLFGVGDFDYDNDEDERTFFMFQATSHVAGISKPVCYWGSKASHITGVRKLDLPRTSANTPHTLTMYYQDASIDDKRIVGVLDGSTYYASDSSLYFINIPKKYQDSYSGPAPTIFLFATNYIAEDHSVTPWPLRSGFAARWCTNETKIYYVKIYENNNLIRFMTPVLHWTGHEFVPCFYDSVYSTYYYNLGSNTPEYQILSS